MHIGASQLTRSSVTGTARLCAIFALAHSLLASTQVKAAVCRIAGPCYRYGLYRFLYIMLSWAHFAWATRRFLRLPDRDLYRVPAPWSWLMHAGQVASLALVPATIRALGILRSSGLRQVYVLLAGGEPMPEPEAQGPPLAGLEHMQVATVFRFSRHPSNAGALGAALLFPHMTANRVTLAGAVAIYVVLGSLHEEARLSAAYGAVYDRYRQQVPFLLTYRYSRAG